MWLLRRVEMATGAQTIAAGAIAFFMNVKAVLAIGRQTFHAALNAHASVSERKELHSACHAAAFGRFQPRDGLHAFAGRAARCRVIYRSRGGEGCAIGRGASRHDKCSSQHRSE